MENTTVEKVLIGELLVRAEFIPFQALVDALPISLKTGLPIGRVLIAANELNEFLLKHALMAQTMIRNHTVPAELGVQALKLVKLEQIDFEEALKRFQWSPESQAHQNRLGQLLIDAGLLTREQVSHVLDHYATGGLPLGKALVEHKVLTDMQVYAALTAQVLVREGRLTRQEAVMALRTANAAQMPLEKALECSGYLDMPLAALRLGELLVMCNCVTEMDLLAAIEESLNTDDKIGQTMVKAGLITYQILNSALQIQQMVREKKLSNLQAVQVMHKLRIDGFPMTVALEQVVQSASSHNEYLGLPDLLKWSGLVPSPIVDEAVAQSAVTGVPVETVLIEGGKVEEATVRVAARCQDLLNKGRLTGEQAVFALQCWIGCKRSLDEILETLGWNHAIGVAETPASL